MAETVSAPQTDTLAQLLGRIRTRQDDIQRIVDSRSLSDAAFSAQLQRQDALKRDRLAAEQQSALDAREFARQLQLEADLQRIDQDLTDSQRRIGRNLPRGSIVDIFA